MAGWECPRDWGGLCWLLVPEIKLIGEVDMNLGCCDSMEFKCCVRFIHAYSTKPQRRHYQQEVQRLQPAFQIKIPNQLQHTISSYHCEHSSTSDHQFSKIAGWSFFSSWTIPSAHSSIKFHFRLSSNFPPKQEKNNLKQPPISSFFHAPWNNVCPRRGIYCLSHFSITFASGSTPLSGGNPTLNAHVGFGFVCSPVALRLMNFLEGLIQLCMWMQEPRIRMSVGFVSVHCSLLPGWSSRPRQSLKTWCFLPGTF